MFKSRVLIPALAICILSLSACAPGVGPAPPATLAVKELTRAPTAASGVTALTPAPKAAATTKAPSPAPISASTLEPLTYPETSEVILEGQSKQIELVVADAKAAGIGLTRVGEAIGLEGSDGLSGWSLELYQVDDPGNGPTPWQRVGKVIDLALGRDVLADPNYLVGSDSNQPPAVTFSPHHIGESPFASAAAGNPGEAAYGAQWALPAIKPADFTDCNDFTPDIYMFDAPPKASTSALAPTNALAVLPLDEEILNAGCAGGTNHALFVAGLVRTVLPLANVNLYPVLDCHGVGTLWNLLVALNEVRKQSPGSQGTVLNLSLGVQVDPEHYDLNKVLQAQKCPAYATLPQESPPPSDRVTNKELCTLHSFLSRLTRGGAVVVAAAGNDSVRNEQPMQPPALLPNVIGVSAVGPGGVLDVACYSNEGDTATAVPPSPGKQRWVRAPGGLSGATDDGPCEPKLDSCLTDDPSGSCAFGVVSTIQDQNGALGYAYWVGTSFATPFVSGLAGCCVAKNSQQPGGAWASNETAGNVWDAILAGAGASPGGGINVPNTLGHCIE
jgi:hypothetical protein